jgi:hypothetical protein
MAIFLISAKIVSLYYICINTVFAMSNTLRFIIVDDNKLDQLTLLAKAKAFDQLLNIAGYVIAVQSLHLLLPAECRHW